MNCEGCGQEIRGPFGIGLDGEERPFHAYQAKCVELLRQKLESAQKALRDADELHLADESTIFQLEVKLKDANLQIDAFKTLERAARLMVKHQQDKHEFSTCCRDVTPSVAYILQSALDELDEARPVAEKPLSDPYRQPKGKDILGMVPDLPEPIQKRVEEPRKDLCVCGHEKSGHKQAVGYKICGHARCACTTD